APRTIPPCSPLFPYTTLFRSGDVPSQGLYTQQARIALEDDNGAIVGERPLTLGFEVIPAAVMGLKGEFQRSNGVARIDLGELTPDRKSTRLNSSHVKISYAVF